jgi:hypothetical protein
MTATCPVAPTGFCLSGMTIQALSADRSSLRRAAGVLIAACVGLFGCAAAPEKSVQPAPLGEVSAASVLGTKFTGFDQGLTLFGNARYTADVADWKVDGFVTAQMISLLKDSSAISLKALDVGSIPLAALYPKSQSELDPGPLIAAAKSQGSSTLIVVSLTWPVWDAHKLAGTGYGWFNSGFGPLNSRRIFATFRVSVFNVASGKLIASADPIPIKAMPALDIPWRAKFSEIGPSEIVTLRTSLESYLAVGIRLAYEQLGLIPGAAKN